MVLNACQILMIWHFLTSGNKQFYSTEIFKKKMVKMTYICTHAYVRVRRITATSCLQFKLYKQDNSSRDTGQIFVVIYPEKKTTHTWALPALLSSIVFSLPMKLWLIGSHHNEWSLLSFCKILTRSFTIPILLAIRKG